MDKQSLEIRTRQWYEIVLEANSSPLSKKEWCRQNSISLKSFYYWQRKLRQKEAEKLRDVTPAALTCLNCILRRRTDTGAFAGGHSAALADIDFFCLSGYFSFNNDIVVLRYPFKHGVG